MLEIIDRASISCEWELLYSGNDLHPLASLCSDHAPLLLQTDASFSRRKQFQFKSFWPKCHGFLQVVQQAWRCPLRVANLDWLLRNTAKMLTSWNDCFIGNIRMQLEVAKEVLVNLEAAQDSRQLSVLEESLCCEMKLKTLELPSLQRTIARQESWVL
jgi:hypothetical protein